jgi:hypothetical protein
LNNLSGSVALSCYFATCCCVARILFIQATIARIVRRPAALLTFSIRERGQFGVSSRTLCLGSSVELVCRNPEKLRLRILSTAFFPEKSDSFRFPKRPQLSQPWKASDRSARDYKPRNSDFAAAEVAENRQVGGLQTVFSKLNRPLGRHAGPGGGSEILDLAA